MPGHLMNEKLERGVEDASNLYHEEVAFIRINCWKSFSYCWNKIHWYENNKVWRTPWAEIIFPYDEDEDGVQEEINSKAEDINFKTFKVVDFGNKDWSIDGIRAFLIETGAIESDVDAEIVIPWVAEKFLNII